MIRKTMEEIDLEFIKLDVICSNTKIYHRDNMMRSGWLET